MYSHKYLRCHEDYCPLVYDAVELGKYIYIYTGWRTKYRTIDCTHNAVLLLQKHLTSGTELILIGWKIVPNESL